MIPVKDKCIEKSEDSSLSHIRLSKKFKKVCDRLDDGNSFFILLKGVDDSMCTVNDHVLGTCLKKCGKDAVDEQDLFETVLQSFEFTSSTYHRYLSMAQYPLLIINTKRKRFYVIKPENSLQIFNHCFLHFYQFMKIKKLWKEEQKLKTLIKLSCSDNVLDLHTSTQFVTCCLNNILIELSTGKLFLFKHNCHRSEVHKRKFDNTLFRIASQYFE